jgi:hypothetical protein
MGILFSIYEFSPYEQFISTTYVRKSRDGCVVNPWTEHDKQANNEVLLR